MGLHLYGYRDVWGFHQIEVVTDGECGNCGRSLDVAHTAFEVVAMTLAEPLRRAFDEHLEQCGCADRHGFGFGHCDEAMRLFRLMPAGDQVSIA